MRLMLCCGLALGFACGCSQERDAYLPGVAWSDLRAIAGSDDGGLMLAGNDLDVFVRVGEAQAVVGDKLQAICVAGLLDAPGSLGELQDVLGAYADDAELNARYELECDGGRLVIESCIRDGEDVVDVSLIGANGRVMGRACMSRAESERVAAELRGFLMKRGYGEAFQDPMF